MVIALDHLVKWLVVRSIPLGGQRPSRGAVVLHHIHNTGAAFGLFPGAQTVFLAVAVGVSAYIVIAGHRLGGPMVQLGLGLVLGGAVANAIDRVAQGYVVDFIDFHVWPVFNVADMAIVVGILMVGWLLGRSPRRAEIVAE